jgi:hypothetical protein
LQADHGFKGHEVFRAQFGLRLPDSGPGFLVPLEVLPTPTENIVLNGYFSKTTILIAI